MTDLVDIERPLAPVRRGHRRTLLSPEDRRRATWPTATVSSCPNPSSSSKKTTGTRAAYRLKVLLQLGFQEFGTFDFDIARARALIADLGARERPESHRESDLTVFFNHFDGAVLRASALSSAGALYASRPVRLRQVPRRPQVPRRAGAPHAPASGFPARRRSEPARPERHGVHDGRRGRRVLRDTRPGSVSLSRAASSRDRWSGCSARHASRTGRRTSTRRRPRSPPSSWPRRAARSQVGDSDGGDGDIRDIGRDLVRERDQLQRRIDMERSALRHRLGDVHEADAQFPLRRVGLSAPRLQARMVPAVRGRRWFRTTTPRAGS